MQSQACVNQRCRDPCPGTCGLNTECMIVNHNPICSCRAGFTGDPFVACSMIRKQSLICRSKWLKKISTNLIFLLAETPPVPTNPCNPSPCGPNANCQTVNQQQSCSCLAGFIGSPPNCRPECVSSNECSNRLACINQKCQDPCIGACGPNSQCSVFSNTPMCTCATGFTGDPFTGCSPVPSECKTTLLNYSLKFEKKKYFKNL